MKIRLVSVLAVFVLLALSSARSQDTVTVKKVLSGTTFQTTTGEKIALLGLGVPTSRAIDAEDVKEHLATLLEGKTVVLVADSLAGPGKKGTKLRYVYLGDNLVNLQLVREGYATSSRKPAHSMITDFQSVEKEAKANQVGAYATEKPYEVQCSAITRKGTQCSRMTRSLSGRCWQHE